MTAYGASGVSGPLPMVPGLAHRDGFGMNPIDWDGSFGITPVTRDVAINEVLGYPGSRTWSLEARAGVITPSGSTRQRSSSRRRRRRVFEICVDHHPGDRRPLATRTEDRDDFTRQKVDRRRDGAAPSASTSANARMVRHRRRGRDAESCSTTARETTSARSRSWLESELAAVKDSADMLPVLRPCRWSTRSLHRPGAHAGAIAIGGDGAVDDPA